MKLTDVKVLTEARKPKLTKALKLELTAWFEKYVAKQIKREGGWNDNLEQWAEQGNALADLADEASKRLKMDINGDDHEEFFDALNDEIVNPILEKFDGSEDLKENAFLHAKRINCPKCGAKAGENCIGVPSGTNKGKDVAPHHERVRAMGGGSAKDFGMKAKAMAEAQRQFRNIEFSSPTTYSGEYSDDGKNWWKFSANSTLAFIYDTISSSNKALNEIWNYISGGDFDYDWSFIRDADPEDKEEMLKIAKKYGDFDKFMKRIKDAEKK